MRKWLPLAAISLGAFMLLIDVTIVNVALPDMAIALRSSFTGLQWVIDIYAIALAALLLGAGALADRAGHRLVYVGGLVLFALSSLSAGLAPSTEALIAARGVQGIGAAAMFATTISLINASYHGRDRGIAFGVWGAANGAAAAAGPILGGLLTQGLSWRWIFFVNLPISVVAVALSLRVLPRERGRGGTKIDVPGVALFTIAAGALTYALTRAAEDGFGATTTIALLALAAAAGAAFLAWQARAESPIIELALLRRPAFSGVLIAALLYTAGAFSYFPYVSLWLQSVRGMTPIGAGLVLVPMSLTALIASMAVGRVLHGISPRLPIGGGLTLIGAGALLQAHLSAGSSWGALMAGLIVVGVGVGMASPTLASAALAAVPISRSGMAAGAVNTTRQLGYALGIAVLGVVCQAQMAGSLASRHVADSSALAGKLISGEAQAALAGATPARRGPLDAAIHAAFASGLNLGIVVSGAIGLAGAAIAFAMVRPQRGPRPEPEASQAQGQEAHAVAPDESFA